LSKTSKIVVLLATTLVSVAFLAVFVVNFLLSQPAAVAAARSNGSASLTLQTVGSVGFGSQPSWVSYLVRNTQGKWLHSTVYQVPAHSVVHVTILQFDGSSGLRNPFWSRVMGTVGNVMRIDGKTRKVIYSGLPAHSFAIPALGVSVPLQGVPAAVPNFCTVAPCSMKDAHYTITFAFRTGNRGTFRWQCFVPCGAGFLYGNGGPMQTLGYMDGYIQVV
jgi:hypothetical protein